MRESTSRRREPNGISVRARQASGGVLLLLFLGIAVSVAAYNGQPALRGALPLPRPTATVQVAPQREPVVLQSEVLPSGVVHTIVALPAIEDTYIASQKPQQNLGLGPLYLGFNLDTDFFGAERVLLRFDIAGGLPGGVVVHEATLRLHLSKAVPDGDTPMGTVLRRMASPWGEESVTWNTEPAWGEIRTSAFVSSTLQFYEWTVTDLVADWEAGVYPNYGMEIIGDERIQERERVFYSRETPTDLFPRLIVDYTVSTDNQPPVVEVNPLPQFSPRAFIVSWSGIDIGDAGINHYDVQYREEGGDWIDWRTNVTYASDDFVGGFGTHLYEFRARGVDNVGNVEPYGPAEAATTVDTTPPSSTILPLPALIHTDGFTVGWTGSDAGIGIDDYDVRYRFDGGPWMDLLPGTVATSISLNNQVDGVYDFEVRAVDGLGNVEMFRGVPEASTVVDAVAPFVVARSYLPITIR